MVYANDAPDTDTRKQFRQLKQAFVQVEAEEVGALLQKQSELKNLKFWADLNCIDQIIH